MKREQREKWRGWVDEEGGRVGIGRSNGKGWEDRKEDTVLELV